MDVEFFKKPIKNLAVLVKFSSMVIANKKLFSNFLRPSVFQQRKSCLKVKIAKIAFIASLFFIFLPHPLFSSSHCEGERSKSQLGDFLHDEFVPVEEVKRTDKLEGITRMAGNCMVRFDLEVLSVMLNSSPGEGSILAEIKTPLFIETGVLAGMSGSPVYLNKKLVGAVAYTVPNLKKPIVGITPIHAMLRLQNYLPANSSKNISLVKKQPLFLRSSLQGYGQNSKNNNTNNNVLNTLGGNLLDKNTINSSYALVPIPLAVTSGKGGMQYKKMLRYFLNSVQNINFNVTFEEDAFTFNKHAFTKPFLIMDEGNYFPLMKRDNLQKWNNNFYSKSILTKNSLWHAPLRALQVSSPNNTSRFTTARLSTDTAYNGNATEDDKNFSRVVPGDLIGVNLVRGDLDISAYGTVTYVKDNFVYAFGHSMDLAGPTVMPMYKAFVDAVVPRTDFSYKVGSLVQEMGVIVEDRKTGILGLRGKVANRVPLTIKMNTEDHQKKFFFEVAEGLSYGPALFATLVNLTFEQYEGLGKKSPLNYTMQVKLQHTKNSKQTFSQPSAKNVFTQNLSFSGSYAYQPLQNTYMQAATDVFRHLFALKENAFENVQFSSIAIEVNDEGQDTFWQMDRVELAKTAFLQDEPIAFTLHFNTYRGEKKKMPLQFTAPKPLLPGNYLFTISTEEQFVKQDRMRNPSRFRAENFQQWIKNLQLEGRRDKLIVSTIANRRAYRFNDEIYPNLPYNALQKLNEAPTTKKDVIVLYATEEFPINTLVLGSVSFAVEVK